MNLGGLLLAGGRSSRMGQDKAQLCVRGESLLTRQWRLLAELCAEENCRVSGRSECHPSLPDLSPKSGGPLRGLEAALALWRPLPDWLLLLPVDMPRVTAPLLRRLANAASEFETGQGAVVEGLWLPLVIRTGWEVSGALQSVLAGPPEEHSVRRLAAQLNLARVVPTPSEAIQWEGVNTPEEWASFLAEQSI